MSISLDPETQKLIEERMRRGGYSTADDVVRAGLASLDQQESAGDFGPGELDELLAQGERSGEPLDGEQVLAELRDLRSRHMGQSE
jgi:putative addiction module CopG family antidote